MRNHSQTEEPSGASVTRHTHWDHATPTTSTYSLSLFLKKIDFIPFQILTHSVLTNYLFVLTKTWPATSVPTTSMLPIANKSSARLALNPHAEHAIKHSSVAMMSLPPSASSATLYSLILSFNTSVSPSSFFSATSPSTNKTFSSLKNKPCFRQHKPPSRMTSSSRTLMHRLRMSRCKSNNLRFSNLICCRPNDNCNAKGRHLIPMQPMISSFIAALIPTATASSLPLGSALHAKNTPALIAGNQRPLTTILFTFATPTHSLLSRFSNPLPNRAQIARFPFTKQKAAIKCSAPSANAFGLGTPASLNLAVTTRTTYSGCAKINHTACLAIPAMSCAVAKLILTSFLRYIASSGPPSLHYLAITTLTFSALYSPHFHPSLICAITICTSYKSPTAFTSIFPLARRSFPISCLLQNSNNSHDATIYSSSKMKISYKSYRPSFKPPPTSPSAFINTFRYFLTHKHLHFLFLPLMHKFNPSPLNCSTSNYTPTKNSFPFTTTSIPRTPNVSSFPLTTSNFKPFTPTSHSKTLFHSIASHHYLIDLPNTLQPLPRTPHHHTTTPHHDTTRHNHDIR
jgi:hypothetical protein